MYKEKLKKYMARNKRTAHSCRPVCNDCSVHLLGTLGRTGTLSPPPLLESVKPFSGCFLLLLEHYESNNDAQNQTEDGTKHNQEELGSRHCWGWIFNVISGRCKI